MPIEPRFGSAAAIGLRRSCGVSVKGLSVHALLTLRVIFRKHKVLFFKLPVVLDTTLLCLAARENHKRVENGLNPRGLEVEKETILRSTEQLWFRIDDSGFTNVSLFLFFIVEVRSRRCSEGRMKPK